jgi:hypothetical protein
MPINLIKFTLHPVIIIRAIAVAPAAASGDAVHRHLPTKCKFLLQF